MEVGSGPCDATSSGRCKLRITILRDGQWLLTEWVAKGQRCEGKLLSCCSLDGEADKWNEPNSMSSKAPK